MPHVQEKPRTGYAFDTFTVVLKGHLIELTNDSLKTQSSNEFDSDTNLPTVAVSCYCGLLARPKKLDCYSFSDMTAIYEDIKLLIGLMQKIFCYKKENEQKFNKDKDIDMYKLYERTVIASHDLGPFVTLITKPHHHILITPQALSAFLHHSIRLIERLVKMQNSSDESFKKIFGSNTQIENTMKNMIRKKDGMYYECFLVSKLEKRHNFHQRRDVRVLAKRQEVLDVRHAHYKAAVREISINFLLKNQGKLLEDMRKAIERKQLHDPVFLRQIDEIEHKNEIISDLENVIAAYERQWFVAMAKQNSTSPPSYD